MTDFLLKQWKEEGKINGNQFVGSTIVSTELVNDVAASYNVETKVGLTGFKWIAKMVRDFPEHRFYWWWRRKLWLYGWRFCKR